MVLRVVKLARCNQFHVTRKFAVIEEQGIQVHVPILDPIAYHTYIVTCNWIFISIQLQFAPLVLFSPSTNEIRYTLTCILQQNCNKYNSSRLLSKPEWYFSFTVETAIFPTTRENLFSLQLSRPRWVASIDYFIFDLPCIKRRFLLRLSLWTQWVTREKRREEKRKNASTKRRKATKYVHEVNKCARMYGRMNGTCWMASGIGRNLLCPGERGEKRDTGKGRRWRVKCNQRDHE